MGSERRKCRICGVWTDHESGLCSEPGCYATDDLRKRLSAAETARREAEAERDRWRAEAERLCDRACWTPVLREKTKTASDVLIREAANLARWGRGAAATAIREARDVLALAIGRLETERDESRAEVARLRAAGEAACNAAAMQRDACDEYDTVLRARFDDVRCAFAALAPAPAQGDR